MGHRLQQIEQLGVTKIGQPKLLAKAAMIGRNEGTKRQRSLWRGLEQFQQLGRKTAVDANAALINKLFRISGKREEFVTSLGLNDFHAGQAGDEMLEGDPIVLRYGHRAEAGRVAVLETGEGQTTLVRL